MITYRNGDILESGADVILHQVNCMGVMGAGLAKQVRDKHPSVYKRYHSFVESYNEPLETLLGFSLWASVNEDIRPPFVVNCFAQYGYGGNGIRTDYAALRRCFEDTKFVCGMAYSNCTIAIPYQIGCGLARGDWRVVKSIIEDVFGDYGGEVQIWKL